MPQANAPDFRVLLCDASCFKPGNPSNALPPQRTGSSLRLPCGKPLARLCARQKNIYARGLLNSGGRLLNSGSRLLNSGGRLLNSGGRLLNSGSRLLNSGGRLLNSDLPILIQSNAIAFVMPSCMKSALR